MAGSAPIVRPCCGVGCNLDLTLDENSRPVKCGAMGHNPELNAKYDWVKGFTVHELLNHPERLTQPTIRKVDKLKHFNTGEMSWRTTKSPKLKPAAYLDMNPADAEETQLGEDDTVRITQPSWDRPIAA